MCVCLCSVLFCAIGKGTYVHSPFLCVAISNLIGPSFGLPFVTASLPHSPQFVLALTGNSPKHKNAASASASASESASAHGSNAVTFENRIAPLLVYFLIGLVSFVPSVIRCIPLGNTGSYSCFQLSIIKLGNVVKAKSDTI